MTTTEIQNPSTNRLNVATTTTSVSITKSQVSADPAVAGQQAETTMSLETSADAWSPATSAAQHGAGNADHATETHEENHGELLLSDTNFVEAASATAKTPTATAGEALSLPAALVDDGLLEEIAGIPDKMGFKIGDVADLLDVKQYVLRYWETEFEVLRPKKASNNQRMYTRKDVENAFLIRKLLYRDRFSIEGARQVLREMKQQVRREKDISQVVQKLGSASDHLIELAAHVRRLRLSFR